jgi:uracil-DNA glycosylase
MQSCAQDPLLHSWCEQVELLANGYTDQLLYTVAQLRLSRTIYPAQDAILRALRETSFDAVRVVIVGQDPYHQPAQAQGLAFSVPPTVKPPPSLRNIFKEIRQDIYGGEQREFSPELVRWARQGVLLLNTVLTVEEGRPASHDTVGWHALTDAIIAAVGQKRSGVVFLLWGNFAQTKSALIDERNHLVLKAAHPSPLSASRGFFGCRHFSKTNEYLVQQGGVAIEW